MYKYVESNDFKNGEAITDVLVVTKKGVEHGGLFKGIIIPNTTNETVRNIIRDYPGDVWAAHHASWGKDNLLLYVKKYGYINRFGWYLITDAPIAVPDDIELDIAGQGWVKRVPVKDGDALKKLLNM